MNELNEGSVFSSTATTRLAEVVDVFVKDSAAQLHACDMFLAAADAEFLQTCHGVACAASTYLVTLQMSHFTYLFSFRTQYWLKCYYQ